MSGRATFPSRRSGVPRSSLSFPLPAHPFPSSFQLTASALVTLPHYSPAIARGKKHCFITPSRPSLPPIPFPIIGKKCSPAPLRSIPGGAVSTGRRQADLPASLPSNVKSLHRYRLEIDIIRPLQSQFLHYSVHASAACMGKFPCQKLLTFPRISYILWLTVSQALLKSVLAPQRYAQEGRAVDRCNPRDFGKS